MRSVFKVILMRYESGSGYSLLIKLAQTAYGSLIAESFAV